MELLHDNVPKLLEKQGKIVKTRTARNNDEFFKLLHKKAQHDLNRIFQTKDLDDKMYATIEMMANMSVLVDTLASYKKVDFWGEYDKRINVIGGLDKRLVLTGGYGHNEDAVRKVKEYAEKNNYPSIVIKRDENGNPYKQIGNGEESWMAAISWADLNSPHNENFDDLVRAVENAEEDRQRI